MRDHYRSKYLAMITNVLSIVGILCILSGKQFGAAAAVINMYQSPTTIIDNQIHYEYRYSIEDPVSGVISEKWESRLGDYVKGRYSFLQADGLVQTVHYESDSKLGYRAIVQTSKPASSYLTQYTDYLRR